MVGEKAAALSRPRPVVKGVQSAIAGANVFEVAFLEGCSQALFTGSLEHVPGYAEINNLHLKKILVHYVLSFFSTLLAVKKFCRQSFSFWYLS